MAKKPTKQPPPPAAKPKKPKPQPGKNKAIRAARRKVIVQKLIAQTPVETIARQVNLTPQAVNYEIRQPETQALIRGMLYPHHAAIARMIPRALAAINKTLKPGNEPINRMRASKMLGYYLELAEGRQTDENTNRPARFSGTMEELLILYRKTTEGQQPETSGA